MFKMYNVIKKSIFSNLDYRAYGHSIFMNTKYS